LVRHINKYFYYSYSIPTPSSEVIILLFSNNIKNVSAEVLVGVGVVVDVLVGVGVLLLFVVVGV